MLTGDLQSCYRLYIRIFSVQVLESGSHISLSLSALNTPHNAGPQAKKQDLRHRGDLRQRGGGGIVAGHGQHRHIVPQRFRLGPPTAQLGG